MQAKIALRHKTATAAYFIHQGSLPNLKSETRTDAIVIGAGAYRLEGHPMIARAEVVYQQTGLGIDIADDNGNAAIVPQVGDGESAG